jgi:TIR domain-containing protein
MADIFISYAKADGDLAQRLAAQLEAQGRTTWWEARLLADQGLDSAAARELENAQKVIVLWTRTSIASPFILHEAITAGEAGKLLQVKTSDIQISEIPRVLRGQLILDASDLAAVARTASSKDDEGIEREQHSPLDGDKPDPAAPTSAADIATPRLPPVPAVPPTRVLDRAASRTKRSRIGMFAVAAMLVATIGAAVIWLTGILDGFAAFATKLLALPK